jgi:hypothetical protein
MFYIPPDKKLMMVDFDPQAKSATAVHVLFQTRIIGPNFSDTQYAVSPDGSTRFPRTPPHPLPWSPAGRPN